MAVIDQVSESVVLAPEARSPSASRRFVERALTRWELDVLADTAVLLTSELVTNAIVHAQTEVAVTIRREGRHTVSVSVTDGSATFPRLASHSSDAATGRGLGILDMLASSWEVVTAPEGKTVTFTLQHLTVPDACNSPGQA